MAVPHIDKNNFETEVLKTKGVVLVDFYATWCGPCKTLNPILDDISATTDIKVIKIDVDKNQGLAIEYRI